MGIASTTGGAGRAAKDEDFLICYCFVVQCLIFERAGVRSEYLFCTSPKGLNFCKKVKKKKKIYFVQLSMGISMAGFPPQSCG